MTLRARITTDRRYGTYNGLPVPGRITKERNTLDYQYEDGEHWLTIWGPYLDPDADSDLSTTSDDPAHIVKYLAGYPENEQVAELIRWLEGGADPAAFPDGRKR